MKNRHLPEIFSMMGSKTVFYLMLFIAGVLWVPTAQAQQDCALAARVDNLLDANVSGGTTGFYLKKVGGSVIAASNSTTVFEPASAIKVLFHAHAMRRVQMDDGTTLSTDITWERDLDDDRSGARPRFPGFCTPANPDLEKDDLRDVLRGMMENSDNRHTQAVRDFFGNAQIMGTANALGLTQTDLNHNIGCICNNRRYNQTTLRDLGRIYEGVATGFLAGADRQQFYDLMLNGTAAIRNIIDSENATVGLSPTELADFKGRIRYARKGGSYDCGASELWRSNAGWVQLPFKTSPTTIKNSQYVFGAFANRASAVNMSITTISHELLRDEIRAALQTWAAGHQTITEKASYTAGKVGTYLGDELPPLSGVVDVLSLSSTRAITAIRTENGKLKLTAYTIGNGGASISRKGSYTTGVGMMQVKAVKLSSSRFATAYQAAGGKLWVSVWDVSPAGAISHAGSRTADNVYDLDIIRLSSGRIVTPIATEQTKLKVIVWDINASGQLSKKGEHSTGSTNMVAGDRLSPTRFVTAIRDISFGNLKLQSWQVTTSGNVTLRGTASAGAVSDINLTGLTNLRFVSHLQQGNLMHKSIAWEVCPDNGDIRRVSDGSTHTDIREVSGAKLRKTSTIVATRRKANHKLDMSTWDMSSGSYLVRTGRKVGEVIGQVEVAGLYSSSAVQRYLTAYTNASGNLKLVVWQVGASSSATITETAGTRASQYSVKMVKTTLEQNYPNPVRTTTHLPFLLEEPGEVEIQLMDIQGQRVKTLFSGFREKGQHDIIIDLSDLPRGTYFYQLATKGAYLTKKMVLTE